MLADAAAPPVVASYLEACDAGTLATYGTPDTTGVVADPTRRAACLIAWDDQAQAVTSGVTITCVAGDAFALTDPPPTS